MDRYLTTVYTTDIFGSSNDHVGESKCQLKNIRLLLKILEW